MSPASQGSPCLSFPECLPSQSYSWLVFLYRFLLRHVDSLSLQIEMLEHLNAEELLAESPRFFALARKQDFVKRSLPNGDAAAIAKRVETFNDTLKQFEAMTRIHAYVQWRKSRFLPIPETQARMEVMMRDFPGPHTKDMKMKAMARSKANR
jgi:hypothetical protein